MERVKLKDICRLINGRAYKQEELLDSGKYPVLRVGNFFSDKDFYYSDLELEEDKYCDNGDLLFAWSASFGPKIWDGEKVIYHYHIWKMELTDRVNKEFLFYYLFHLSERIKSEGHGGIMIHTTKSEMEEREFNLPTHEEQIAISEILNKVKSVIDKRKEELSALDDLIKARFIELFRNETTRMTMSEVCSIITDGTHQPPKFKSDGIPFIFVSNIAENKLTYNAEKYIDQETYDELIKRTPIEIGDLLLSTVGSYGHPAVVKSDKKFLFQRHIAYLKPRKEIVDSEFLHGAILSSDVQYQIEKAVKGIAQKTLNLSEIKRMVIPVPSMDRQHQFAAFVTEVDKSKVVKQKVRIRTINISSTNAVIRI